jgi:hypothetical protein
MQEKLKRLKAVYGVDEPEKPKSNPIYLNEIEKDVDTLINDEAANIYREETGEEPPEEIPQEYKDKAMVSILKRWQETLLPLIGLMERTAPPLKAEKPKCPKHGLELRKVGENLWRCPYGDYVVKGFYD